MTVTVNYTISDEVNFTEVGGYEPDDPTVAFPTIFGNTDFGFTVSFSISNDGEGGVSLIGVECTSSPDFTIVTNLSNTEIRVVRDETKNVFPGERFEFVKYGYDNEGDVMASANSEAYPPFPENPNDTSADANTPAANSEFEANTSFDDGGTGIIDLNTSIFPTGDEEYGIFESFGEGEALNANNDSSVYAWITPPVTIRTESFTFVVTYIETVSMVEQTETVVFPQEYHWSWVPGLETLGVLVDRSRF